MQLPVEQSVQFVVGANGRPTAALVSIDLWEQILEALEDAEDIATAREALAELSTAGGDPERAGWLKLEDIEADWARDEPQ